MNLGMNHMKIKEIMETSTAGTTAGNIAVVSAPVQARQKIPTDKNGIPKAPQKKNPNGTVKNALDITDNVMGSVARR